VRLPQPVSARRCRLGEVTGQVVLLMLRVRSANPAAAMTACLPAAGWMGTIYLGQTLGAWVLQVSARRI
jgi:hypothetical protein